MKIDIRQQTIGGKTYQAAQISLNPHEAIIVTTLPAVSGSSVPLHVDGLPGAWNDRTTVVLKAGSEEFPVPGVNFTPDRPAITARHNSRSPRNRQRRARGHGKAGEP